jgi:hypothetical protein
MEPCFVYFFLKINILKFQKFHHKILDVANDVVYGRAKSQQEIVCIPAYAKREILTS